MSEQESMYGNPKKLSEQIAKLQAQVDAAAKANERKDASIIKAGRRYLELQAQVDELQADGGAAAWILEWMVADKYRKPEIPSIIRHAKRMYQKTIAENREFKTALSGRCPGCGWDRTELWETEKKETKT